MRVEMVPDALSERLGLEATDGLVELFDEARDECVADAVNVVTDRFERRLVEEVSKLRVDMAAGLASVRQEMASGDAAIRQELATGLAGVRQEIATSRVEFLKWSFVFWVGQILAFSGVMLAILRR